MYDLLGYIEKWAAGWEPTFLFGLRIPLCCLSGDEGGGPFTKLFLVDWISPFPYLRNFVSARCYNHEGSNWIFKHSFVSNSCMCVSIHHVVSPLSSWKLMNISWICGWRFFSLLCIILFLTIATPLRKLLNSETKYTFSYDWQASRKQDSFGLDWEQMSAVLELMVSGWFKESWSDSLKFKLHRKLLETFNIESNPTSSFTNCCSYLSTWSVEVEKNLWKSTLSWAPCQAP